MLELPGYTITEEIVSGIRTNIYRGTRERDGKPVIVKVLKSEYPTLSEIACLRQEYTIPHDVESNGIVKPYSLEPYGKSYALVLEDIGGQSLSQVLSFRQFSLTEFLTISISLASTLGHLHQVPIIHKDIKPSNIIININTGDIRLTDFGIASRLSRESPTIRNPDLLEGTLAYMSPEQTGRMNRGIDYRSDLYSLGVTFYELLTGQLPFNSMEAMELVHCHIAKQPVPPHKVKPGIPQVLSSIVMKLLSKTAEARYQTSAGLRYDLETCLEQLKTTGSLETYPTTSWHFTPGKRDRGNQLLIPQKLYGREQEIQTLMDTFERVRYGATEMMLVSGYSGIGKTAIVNEVHKPIVKARGYFISGKFDQFKRNIPYSALIQALSHLIHQLFTEGRERIALWKEKLLEAIGTNGQVIVDVIPEVELIIGEQPALPELGASESQNRFNRVFQQFVSVFCQSEHPLVMFIDDLQWADSASLKLIQLLTSNSDSKYLFLIGAYRDNEVYPTHPLIQTIEKIVEAGTSLHNIIVKPLTRKQVGELLAETLEEVEEELPKDKNSVAPTNSSFAELEEANSWVSRNSRLYGLIELVFNKTQGNPFFLTQLLKTLHAEDLLVYEVVTGKWDWDLRELQAVGIIDYNIVELIARNIQKLPETTQRVLKLAACIGNQFNLEILAIANDESPMLTAAQMWDALQAGLLLPLSDTYKIPLAFSSVSQSENQGLESETVKALDVNVDYRFLHDRVQQAAYSLIPESEKKVTHLKIGKQLLENTTAEEQDENIFAIVNQLNYGRNLLATNHERNKIAELNLIAGQKAKASAAYEASLSYLKIGLEMLQSNCWEKTYNLAFDLHLETIEVEYLNSNFEASKEIADLVLNQSENLLEKVKVYELQIQAYVAENKMQAALELGQEILQMLGVRLEEQQQPKEEEVNIEQLAELPEMADLNKIAALRIANLMNTPAFISNPILWAQIGCTEVNLCITYGNSPLSPMAYIDYAMLLCGRSDLDLGYQFGKLALMMLDKFNARNIKSIVLDLFNGHIRHWKEHAKETIEPLKEAVQSGLETGELVFSGYAALSSSIHPFLIGAYLEDVDEKFVHYLELLQKQKLEYHIIYGQIGQQLVLNLLGRSESQLKLIGSAFNEEEILPILVDKNNGTSLFYAYVCKQMLLYLMKEPALAIESAIEAEKYIGAAAGMFTVPQHNLYYSLALLAEYPKMDKTKQQEAWEKVIELQEIMKNWAHHAPSNFQHKYKLVEAEKARVQGNYAKAMDNYDEAILGAKKQGYTHEEALANELAGEFHIARGKENIGTFYILEAYYGYIRWGAIAKVKDLESRYPQIQAKVSALKKTVSIDDISVTRTKTTTTSNSRDILDLPAAIAASQAISSEIVLSELLQKLMRLVIENAGAQKGFLLIADGDRLTVEVSGEVEGGEIVVSQAPAADIEEVMPNSVLNYVQRTQQDIVFNDASNEAPWTEDIDGHRKN